METTISEDESGDKETRKECAQILTMTEVECTKLLADMLWNSDEVTSSLLNTLHNNVKSPTEAMDILAHKNSCIEVVADLDCNGKTDYREYDLVVFPFSNRKTWIRLHRTKPQFKQCIQLLLNKRTFTIRKMAMYGLSAEWRSFRQYTVLNQSLDKNRVGLLQRYIQLVTQKYSESYTPEELSRFTLTAGSLIKEVVSSQRTNRVPQ